VALCRDRGFVRSRRVYVGEEGSVLRRRLPHKVRRFVGEDVGEEVLFLAAVGDYLAVLVDPVVVELLSVEFAVPLVPARRDVSGITGRIAVEVLAEEGGPVADPLQAHTNRVFFVTLGEELLEASVRWLIAQYVVVVIVEAGQDSRARRAAYGVADESLVKGGALVC